MRLFLTGDSHLGALRRTLLAPGRAAAGPNEPEVVLEALGRGQRLRDRFFEPRADFVEITDPDFRQRVKQVPPAGPRFDWVGVCAPLNTARVWRHQDFARYRPIALGGGTPVSTALLQVVVEEDVGPTLDFIKAAQRHVPVFVVDAPWPFARHPSVQRSGADLVQYIHRWYRAHVMRELAALGVPVVEVPPSCVDDKGFMLERFRSENARDLYHANASFGHLMIDRIIERFSD
jgi:hypothetical protein